jgi:hypothetical protein
MSTKDLKQAVLDRFADLLRSQTQADGRLIEPLLTALAESSVPDRERLLSVTQAAAEAPDGQTS